MGFDLVRLTTILLAILAIASVVASRRSIAEAWRSGQRLQAASAQVLVTGGMLTEATFVQNRALMQIGVVALFVAILVFAELSDGRLRRHHIQARVPPTYNRTPVLSILLLWAWLYAVNLWFMADEASNNALYRTASGVALVLFLITQRYRPVTLLHFYSAALLTVSAIAVALPFSAGIFTPCGNFKCNAIGVLLHGPFPSENSLGFAAAMCAVLYVIAVPRSRSTAIVLAFLVATIYATYSRTSLLALGAAMALGVVQILLSRKPAAKNATVLANVVAMSCAVIPMIAGMALVYRSGSGAFSDRGRIWALGRTAASEYPVTGRGLDSWNLLTNSGFFGKHFALYPHSEYLLIYFSGGLVGLILFAVVIHRITYIAILAQNSLARGAVLPVYFVTAAMTETIWNPLSVDVGTWIFFALVAACVPLGQHAGRPERLDLASVRLQATPSP